MKKSQLNFDALDDFPIGILIEDKNDCIVWANKKAAKEIHLKKKDFKNKNITEILDEQDSLISKSKNREIFETGKPKFGLIQQMKLKNNNTIWVKIDRFPLYNDKNELEEIIVFANNITDHVNDLRERVFSESKYRNLFESSPYSIAIIDLQGIILDCNLKTAELFDLKEDEIVGIRFDKFFMLDEIQRKRIVKYFEAISQGEKINPIEITVKLNNSGITKILEIYPSLLNRENVPYAYQVITRDLTEKFQTEKELKETQDLFSSFMENLSSIAFMKDLQDRYLFINKSYENLIQKPKDECLGKTDLELWGSDSAEIYIKTDQEILEKKIPAQFIEQTNVNGKIRTWIVNKFPIFKDETPLGVGGIGIDITEQKKIEKLLRIQRDFGIELSKKNDLSEILKLFVDTAIEISEMDSGGINLFEEKSDHLKYQTGFTEEYISFILKYDPNSNVIDIAKSGKAIYWNYNDLTNLNNEKFNKEGLRSIAIIPLKLGNVIIGYLNLASHTQNEILEVQKNALETIISHIGEVIGRLQVQEQKEKLQKEVLNSQKLESLGILTGGIAHDFNNILTAILGSISLAEISTNDPKELKFCLLEAKKALTRAKDLTQQLLTFSKGGAPIKKLANTSVFLDLLTETTNFALRGSNVRCDFDIDEDLWAVEVDQGQISQVINNLIINAMQAMPEGGIIKLKAENVTLEKNTIIPLPSGNYIKVSIEDEGIGIHEKYLTKIFDPYFTTKEKGSGLGLATSYSIIRRHEGYIKVESEVGVGTTFSFLLPAYPYKISFNVTPKINIKTGTGRILLMDDEESILTISKKVLEKLGYDIETAFNGDEAILKYRLAMEKGHKFKLVIMDLTIPGGMGGRELIKELLHLDPEIKAIVSSGYSTDPIMANYKTYGFKGVITKPYKIEEISQVIENVMNDEEE